MWEVRATELRRSPAVSSLRDTVAQDRAAPRTDTNAAGENRVGVEGIAISEKPAAMAGTAARRARQKRAKLRIELVARVIDYVFGIIDRFIIAS